jgi:alkylhydroperoxidase family enzyme
LCAYSVSAHTTLGQRAGLTPGEIADAVRACAADPHTDALLKLARTIVVRRGEVSDADLERARAAGLTDCEVVETVANVALNIFTNYVAHVTRTAVDSVPPSSFREEHRD